MNKTWKKLLMAAFVAVFVSGAVLAPAATQVFAAEQTTDQGDQNKQSDAPNNDHSGHHG